MCHGREALFQVSVRSVNGVLRRRGNAGGPATPASTDYNVISMADPVVTDNPYAADWIERHSDDADLVDTDLLARMESRP